MKNVKRYIIFVLATDETLFRRSPACALLVFLPTSLAAREFTSFSHNHVVASRYF